MKYLHLLRYPRIAICLVIILSIKFGNYNCVEQTKSGTELKLKNDSDVQVTAVAPLNHEYEEDCDETDDSENTTKWKHLNCKKVSLRGAYFSFRNKEWTPESMQNMMFSLVMLLNLMHLFILVVELLLAPGVQNGGSKIALCVLLGFESLAYLTQVIVAYFYCIRWQDLTQFDTKGRPIFFAAILVLFSFSELFYFTEVFISYLVVNHAQMQVVSDGARHVKSWRGQKYVVTKPDEANAGEPNSSKIKLFEQEMFTSKSESTC